MKSDSHWILKTIQLNMIGLDIFLSIELYLSVKGYIHNASYMLDYIAYFGCIVQLILSAGCVAFSRYKNQPIRFGVSHIIAYMILSVLVVLGVFIPGDFVD